MIRIAIVEDDMDMNRQISEYVDRYAQSSGQKIEVSVFSDGDEIAENYKLGFDIILMDIQMKFMDGLTAAKLIRSNDPDVVIIFITNMAQYAIHGYEVNALDYVLKPISYFSFSEKLNRAIERMNSRKTKHIVISVDKGFKKLDITKIRYVESQGHRLIFHIEGNSYSTGGNTMKEIEGKLAPYGFFRCNKGYLVNLEYVEGIEDSCAIVNGENILISRAKKNAFLEALTNYVGEEVN